MEKTLIAEKYVYKLIREGKLPKLKGIRSVRVPKVFLINFVLQGAQESESHRYRQERQTLCDIRLQGRKQQEKA